MTTADEAYDKLTTDEIKALRADITEELADDLLALRAAYEGSDVGMVGLMTDHPLWNMPKEYLEVFEAWLRLEADENGSK